MSLAKTKLEFVRVDAYWNEVSVHVANQRGTKKPGHWIERLATLH